MLVGFYSLKVLWFSGRNHRSNFNYEKPWLHNQL